MNLITATMGHTLISDRNAVIDIPHYLLIVIILLLVLTPILYYGVEITRRHTQINRLKQDLHTMMTSAELLSMYADHASRLTKVITVPESVNYVSFQSPILSQSNMTNDTYTQYNSYQICYDDGNVESFSTPFILYNPDSEQYRLYQGTHQIIVEIVTIGDKTYVTMQAIE